MPQPKNIQMNVNRQDVINAPSFVCECGCSIFQHAVVIKKVPGVVFGMGAEPIAVPVDVMVCNKCGKLAPNILEDSSMQYLLEGKPKEESKSGLIL